MSLVHVPTHKLLLVILQYIVRHIQKSMIGCVDKRHSNILFLKIANIKSIMKEPLGNYIENEFFHITDWIFKKGILIMLY